MDFRPRISFSPNAEKIPGKASEAFLLSLLQIEKEEENALEYHAVITNASDRPAWLERVCLLKLSDLQPLGLGPGPYTVFRSGRHKNDMPGTFETGCPDERMQDVSAVMDETGGEIKKGEDARKVVSDHLTLIRDNQGKCLAVEFMTGRDQLFQTCLLLDEAGGFRQMICETEFRVWLDPGASVRTETLRLALTENPEAEVEYFARRKGDACGRRNRRHPSVFCTWYYYGLTVTAEDVLANLRIIRERKLPYQVFQIDEGWEKTLGEYEPNSKFPMGMKELADRIRECELEPGLWSSPFIAHETASVWQTHPEWILREKSGKPCLFPMNDTVYYVFDITRPDTWDYFRDLYRRFTFEWGYTYHKLDFTRAAVIYEQADFFDKGMTLAQAYFRAISAVREGMGEDAFFLLCGGLYDPAIGLVDAQRTGSDVLSMWSSTVNKDGKTAPYTIRQSMTRFYMNHWWANDPDALMIRRNRVMERGLRLSYGLLTGEEVKTTLINQFMGGGIVCQTEPLDRIDEDRLMQLRHIVPVVDRQVRPLSILSGDRFPGGMDVFLPGPETHCVCLINWSDTEDMEIRFSLKNPEAAPEARFAVCDFYAGEYRTGISAGDTVCFPALKPHAATVIKVEQLKDAPVIVRSDGHYSMGAECEELRITGNRLRIRIRPTLPAETHYTVLLPDGYRLQGKKTAEIRLTPESPYAEILLDRTPR